MSRCELTGKAPVVKNKVSHSNMKTKSVAMPNVQAKRMFSRALDSYVRLRISTSALRSMEHVGGFDIYILRQDIKSLSSRALEIRRRIVNKMKAKKAGGKPGSET